MRELFGLLIISDIIEYQLSTEKDVGDGSRYYHLHNHVPYQNEILIHEISFFNKNQRYS